MVMIVNDRLDIDLGFKNSRAGRGDPGLPKTHASDRGFGKSCGRAINGGNEWNQSRMRAISMK
jgi:hypothetical protein